MDRVREEHGAVITIIDAQRCIEDAIATDLKFLNDAQNVARRINGIVPFLNVYALELINSNDKETIVLFVTLLDRYIRHIVKSLCANIATLFVRHRMKASTPGSIAFILFCTLSHCAAIIDAFDKDSIPNFPRCLLRPFKAASTSVPYAIKHMLCAHRTKEIFNYTVKDMQRAIWLLSIQWHTLTFNKELLAYLHTLLHRMMIIISKPATASIFDDSTMRDEIECATDDREARYVASCDLIRYSYGPLIRMIALVDYWLNMREVVDAEPDPVGVKQLAFRILSELKVMSAMSKIRNEIHNLCEKSYVKFGEVETFIQKNNMEVADPHNILMAVKTDECHTSIGLIQELINFSQDVMYVDEDNPDYFTHMAQAHHLFYANSKLYAFEAIVFKLCQRYHKSLNFLQMFVVDESDFASRRSEFATKPYPVLIFVNSRLHVHFDKIYRCKSTEHAIITWVKIIMDKLKGDIMGINYGIVLNEVLHENHNKEKESKIGWGDKLYIKKSG